MSNINKKPQFLDKIAGVQDISHESAAACSGGNITLYDGTNGTGKFYYLGAEASVADLGNFNNIASSFYVEPGYTWRLYTGRNFSGSYATVGGVFGQSGNFVIGFNNNVESMRVV
jgi:hypothetical protein